MCSELYNQTCFDIADVPFSPDIWSLNHLFDLMSNFWQEFKYRYKATMKIFRVCIWHSKHFIITTKIHCITSPTLADFPCDSCINKWKKSANAVRQRYIKHTNILLPNYPSLQLSCLRNLLKGKENCVIFTPSHVIPNLYDILFFIFGGA